MAVTDKTIPARVKLLNSGHDAVGGPYDTNEADKVYEVTLLLTQAGLDELMEGWSLHLLEEQRFNWTEAQKLGNAEPSEDELLANQGAREVYQELLANRKIAGGSILFPTGDECPDIQITDVSSAQSLTDENGDALCGLPDGIDQQLNRWILAFIRRARLNGIIQDGIDGSEILDAFGNTIGSPDWILDVVAGGGGTGSGTDSENGRGKPTGSGENGAPNPDGHDKEVRIADACSNPIINFPYCSSSFSFDHADLRAALTQAAVDSGKFNPNREEIVSFQVSYKGAGYGGVSVNISADTEEHAFTGEGGSIAGVLTSVDALGDEVVWSHAVEKLGVSDVLEVFGYHYHGAVNLHALPTNEPITLTGEMSQLPVLASCRTPPDANDPAWLLVCEIGFIKHSAVPACWKESPYSNPVDSQADCDEVCWPSSDPGGVFRPDAYGKFWRPSHETLIEVYHADKETTGVDFSFSLGSTYAFNATDGRDWIFRAQNPDFFPSPGYIDVSVHVDGDYSASNYSQIPVSGHIDFPVNLPALEVCELFIRDTSDVSAITGITLIEVTP